MTLATILAPLLALCVVARGIGFLPMLGLTTAVAMLVEGWDGPLQQAGAALAAVFAVGPVWFLSFYQHEPVRDHGGPAIPFLALGLMVVLMLASAHPGMPSFPSGLCVLLAGLVTVTCRKGMVWQWAGLLTCVEGVLLAGVLQKQVPVVAVSALAGLLIALLGGLCVHRVTPRVAVVRATGRSKGSKKGKADREQAQPSPLGSASGAPSPDYVPKPPRYMGQEANDA